MIGDAVGRGADAARLADQVRAAWRSAAPHEPTTRGIALRLDSMLAQGGGPEEFVTCLIMTLHRPDAVEIVCCGHPPPLLLHGSGATWADALPLAPPLGLMGLAESWADAGELPFSPGSQMLLLTDGATETRDRDGAFYPLAERVAGCAGPERRLLPYLAADLSHHRAGPAKDDTLLLLIERAVSAP